MLNKIVYKRILLKFSGSALAGEHKFGIDPTVLAQVTNDVGELLHLGVQIGLVIGGGNLFRGATLASAGIDRITADHMGMLATIMNALALRDAFEKQGIHTHVMSAIPMSGIVEPYRQRPAINYLEQSQLVIFAAGTGNPLVTTDAAASLRAIEVKANILIKATSVDGIYTSDPKHDPNAKKYEVLTFTEALQKELKVMDLAAFSQCRDHNMPICVCDLHTKGALLRVVQGQSEGTIVRGEL